MIMLDWVKAKWFQARLNNYVRLRHWGASQEKACRISLVRPEKIAELLSDILGAGVSDAGVITFGASWGSVSVSLENEKSMLVILADLAPLLRGEQKTNIVKKIQDLKNHNWGLIRSAAEYACHHLSVEQSSVNK